MLRFYRTTVVISSTKMKEIELLTSKHSDDDHASVIWKSERRLRITSTSVKAICQRRATTPAAPLVKQMLYNSFKGNAATRYGLTQEKASSIKYLEWLQTHCGSVGASVNQNCGLVVSSTYSWLAATPDGLVIDPSASPLPPEGLVEFKNPYSYRDSLLQNAIDNKKCCCLTDVEGHFSLKHSHEYYHQVQFAMLCTGRTWCDFFISAKDSFGERIRYDEEFCLSLLPKLKRFYFCAILPELTVPRQPIREPKEWITDETLWMQQVESSSSP